jgi:hypothetical protein
VLTDNGSCFTPAFAQACAELGAKYRHTKPYTPQTNGMVERFNRRVSSEVLGITIYSHRDLEQLLRGFNAAYNARRQRVLDGKTPNQVVAERLKERCPFAPAKTHGRAGPDDIVKARLIAESAKEVSQPNNNSLFALGLLINLVIELPKGCSRFPEYGLSDPVFKNCDPSGSVCVIPCPRVLQVHIL